MKQLLAILLTLTLVLSLGGCAGGNRAASASPAPQNGTVSAVILEPTAAVSAPGAPDYITADLGNNITVDARVTQPADGTRLGVYQVETMTLDGEKTLDLLLGEGYRVNPEIPPAEGMEYYIKGDRELIFRHNREGLSFFPGSVGGTFISNLLPTSKVVLETDPDFMSREDAIRLARDTLGKLGIADTEAVRCLPVDQAGVAALAEEFRDRFGGDEESAARYADCPPCYVISFCQTAGGVPICHDDIRLTTGDVNTPDRFAVQPFLQAVVTADGLYELEIDNCVRVGAQIRSGLTALTAGEAAAAIGKCYEDIINTDPTVIRGLSLRYAALPVSLREKGRQLQPVWIVQGERSVYETKRGGEAVEMPLTLYLDALTGQPAEDSFR